MKKQVSLILCLVVIFLFSALPSEASYSGKKVLFIDSYHQGYAWSDGVTNSEMKAFVEANTKVPTGASYDFMAPYVLLEFAKIAEEQGSWAAQAALKILDGTSPANIPVAKNKEGKLIINARIPKTLGVDMPFDIIQSADKVIE